MTKIFFSLKDTSNFGNYQAQVSHRLVDHLQLGKDFSVEFKVESPSKSWFQLRGFYEAINQLLPQYNQRQEEQGEIKFHEHEFKFILKVVGGWYTEIKDKKGGLTKVPKSFTGISKEEMSLVLDRISKWAYERGFSLSIDREMQDLVS